MELLLNLMADELADIPTCNLTESVHNKWLQASGKQGSGLFMTTTNDWVCAFIQMANYRSYLCRGLSGTRSSKKI